MKNHASNGRSGLESGEEMAPVPGLTQVLSAIEMLQRSKTPRVVVSIHHSKHDSELIELSREAAEQSGVLMDVEARDGSLILIFTREGGERR